MKTQHPCSASCDIDKALWLLWLRRSGASSGLVGYVRHCCWGMTQSLKSRAASYPHNIRRQSSCESPTNPLINPWQYITASSTLAYSTTLIETSLGYHRTNTVIDMSPSDIFLGLIAILFPPLAGTIYYLIIVSQNFTANDLSSVD